MKYANNRVIAIGAGACATLLLGACSWVPSVPGMDRIIGEEGVFRDRQGDYLKAQTIPRTEVPAGMDSFIIDDLLVIPDLENRPNEDFLTAPRPRPLEGRSDREVVIQRMENRSWIIVDVSPSEVWPRIRDYWRQESIEIAVENPTAGVMETGWFVLEGNALTKERIRVIIDTGFQDNSSEIRLLQQSSPQSTPDLVLTSWPAASSDPDTEFEVLNGLSSYLADVADLYQASSVSFLAGSIASSGKANLVDEPAGGRVLRLEADFNRSWAAVGRALTRAATEIMDQDAGEGVYLVSYVPGSENPEVEEEEPGFFRKVFTLNGLFSGDDAPPAFPLRIEIEAAGSAVDVRVSPDPAAPLPEDSSQADAEAAAEALLLLIRNTIA